MIDTIDLEDYSSLKVRDDQLTQLEQDVLGSILLDGRMLNEVGSLSMADFSHEVHQIIFGGIRHVSDRAGADSVAKASVEGRFCEMVHAHLVETGEASTIGGIDYLYSLTRSLSSASNASAYARQLKDATTNQVKAAAVARIHSLTRAPANLDRAIAELENLTKLVVGPKPDARDLVRKLDYVLADSLDDQDASFDDELVEGVLGRAAMAVLYGDSNSGKTFAAIDLGAAVAQSEPWMGHPTDGGLVVYLASESPTSVQNRLRAYQRHRGVKVPGFVIVRSPINLFDGQVDTTAVIGLVNALEKEHGTKVALIIGDTLARLAVGANENSGEDMGVVVQNIDAVRSATGAAFLVIHHTGKDAAKGMRGWSGLRAATDTEIEVTCDEATGLRSAEITKQRDLPGKGDRIGFRLHVVTLGKNQWGTERGSCVVLPADAPTKPTRAKRPSEIAGAITEFLIQRGTGCLRGALTKHFEDRYQRQSVYREIKKMLDNGLLIETAGVVALPGKPGVSA